jgi:putative addiction module component (TIGR02574 family)
MNASLAEIERQAALLAPSDRARLAEFLLESLQESGAAEIERAWEIEISRRVAAYESGRMETIPAAEVFAEARRIAR